MSQEKRTQPIYSHSVSIMYILCVLTVERHSHYKDGGLTALGQLYLLDQVFYLLKQELQSDTELRPCDWFDLIIGSGPGGYVSIRLEGLL
jgi:hypothetical protein